MARITLVAAAVFVGLLLFGCGVLRWLDEPMDGSPTHPPASSKPVASDTSAPGATEQIAVKLPGGGLILLPNAPTTPKSIDVPGVGTITITPKGTSSPDANVRAPTNGDALAQGGGGIVTLLTGNAMLGVLAAGGLRALLGAFAPKSGAGASSPEPT